MQISEAAEEVGILPEVAMKAYQLYWGFNKEFIESVPIDSIDSEDNIKGLKLSINLPGLGKVFTSWERINGQRKRYKYIKEWQSKKNLT